MLAISRISGLPYNDDEMVFFKNPEQSAAYNYWGAILVDVIPTEEFKFIFVFSRTDHTRLKLKWKYREGTDEETN